MAKRPARANRMGAIALSLGLIIGVGACSPAHTLDIFDPSDGVGAVLDGEVKATNLLILTTAAGEPGTLVGSLSNVTGNEISVNIAVENANPITVDLEAFNTAYLTPKGPEDKGRTVVVDAQLNSVSAEPGATIPVTITTAAGGSTEIQVPVLNGEIEPYSEYLP